MAKAIERADFYQIGTLFLCCNHYTAEITFCQDCFEKTFRYYCCKRNTAKYNTVLGEYNLSKYEVLELFLHREIKSQRLSLITAMKYLHREVW